MSDMVKYKLAGMDGIMPFLKFSAFCRSMGVQAHPSGVLVRGYDRVGSWSWGHR